MDQRLSFIFSHYLGSCVHDQVTSRVWNSYFTVDNVVWTQNGFIDDWIYGCDGQTDQTDQGIRGLIFWQSQADSLPDFSVVVFVVQEFLANIGCNAAKMHKKKKINAIFLFHRPLNRHIGRSAIHEINWAWPYSATAVHAVWTFHFPVLQSGSGYEADK